MNTSQISKCLENYANFAGVHAFDKTPKVVEDNCGLVYNLDDSSKPGSHWVAVYAYSVGDKKKMIYYDSYGIEPTRETFPWSVYECKFSRQRSQNYNTAVCGQHCILFLVRKFEGKSLKDILRELRGKSDPDAFVDDFVKLKYPEIYLHKCLESGGEQCCITFCPRPPCVEQNK